MKITRKKNGLYRIDDISLEDMTRLSTIYNLRVLEAEENRGVPIPDLKCLGEELEKEIKKAIGRCRR